MPVASAAAAWRIQAVGAASHHTRPARPRNRVHGPGHGPTRVPARILDRALALDLARILVLGLGLGRILDLDPGPAQGPARIRPGHRPDLARIPIRPRLRRRTGTIRSGMPPRSPPASRSPRR